MFAQIIAESGHSLHPRPCQSAATYIVAELWLDPQQVSGAVWVAPGLRLHFRTSAIAQLSKY